MRRPLTNDRRQAHTISPRARSLAVLIIWQRNTACSTVKLWVSHCLNSLSETRVLRAKRARRRTDRGRIRRRAARLSRRTTTHLWRSCNTYTPVPCPVPRAERERATEYRTRPSTHTSDKTQDALAPGPGATPGIRLSVGDVPPPVYCGTTRPEGFSVKLWDLIKPPHLDHLFLSAVVTTHCNVRGLQQGNVPKQPLIVPTRPLARRQCHRRSPHLCPHLAPRHRHHARIARRPSLCASHAHGQELWRAKRFTILT
jgi:hypothetical protein